MSAWVIVLFAIVVLIVLVGAPVALWAWKCRFKINRPDAERTIDGTR
jgi:hypothetical protein